MPGTLFSEKPLRKGRYTQEPYVGYAVTPSDTADLPNGDAQGIHVVGAGAVAVQLDGVNTAVLTLGANSLVPCNVSRVLATGTTATGISALYRGL
jgi:hypothetical protein